MNRPVVNDGRVHFNKALSLRGLNVCIPVKLSEVILPDYHSGLNKRKNLSWGTYKLVNVISLEPASLIWFVGCIRFNGPFRQYFSLYRAVSQREGERGEKDRRE